MSDQKREPLDRAWFEAALDAMSDLVLIKGPRSRLLWANSAFRKVYGTSNEELKKLVDDAEHSDPDDTLQYVRDDQRVFASGQTLRVIEPVSSANDTVRFFETVKSPICDENGKVTRTIGVSRVCTTTPEKESGKLERGSRHAKGAALRSVISTLPLPVVALDANRRVIAASRGLSAVAKDGAAIIGTEFEKLFPGTQLNRSLAAAIDRGESTRETVELNSRWLDVSVEPWKLDDGLAAGALVVLHDVSALRESENRLRSTNTTLEQRNLELGQARDQANANRSELQMLFELINAGVVVLNNDEDLLLWNREAARLLSIGDEVAPLKRDSESYGIRDESGQVLSSVELPLTRIARGEIISEEIFQLRGQGEQSERWILLSGQQLPSSSSLGAAMAVFVDISQQVAARKELEEFAFVASHDLQEPVRMIRSYTELLKEEFGDQLNDEGNEYMEVVISGAKRIRQLIKDLLKFSRMSQAKLSTSWVDVGATIANVKHDLRVSLDGADVHVGEMPHVEADLSTLTVLCTNLLGNAAKFRSKERDLSIDIKAEKLPSYWKFSVRDNGVGFDQSYGPQAFKMFQRLHSSKDFPGTGIGLALCKRIVERHGGQIGVQTEQGLGSTFWFTLRRSGQ